MYTVMKLLSTQQLQNNRCKWRWKSIDFWQIWNVNIASTWWMERYWPHWLLLFFFRSRLPGGAVFLKSYLKKSWKKSHEKILQWTLFFRKDARTAGNFSKKETPSLFFSCEFCDIFSNSFFKKHFRVTAFVFSSSGSWFHARVKVSFTFIASHTIKSS